MNRLLRLPSPYLQLFVAVLLYLTFLALALPRFVQQPLNLVFVLWLGAAGATVTGRFRDFWFVVALGWTPALLELAVPEAVSPLGLQILKEALWVAFPLYLVTILIAPLLRAEDVSHHELSGAVTIYLLIGFGFADIFEIAYQLDSSSIFFLHTAFGAAPTFTDFLYFSFVTLATLGYGDIAPVHPGVRLLVVMEALLGLLFISILVARMVGLHIAGRMPGTRPSGS